MQVSDIVCVRKWGGSTADAILDPASQTFRTPEVDGLVGFRVENSCAIVFGDPVCPLEHIKELIVAFHKYCLQKNLRVIYLIVSENFARWLIENKYCQSMIEYGKELVLDPHDDPRKKEGIYASLVRRKARQASRNGVVVHEYIPHNDQVEEGIKQVGEKWLGARKGPQIHISHIHTFANRHGKRWLYAKQNEHIVGVVTLNQLENQKGWLMNHLMYTPEASNGVAELLVVSTLELLAAEDCKFVTFGAVPASQLGEMVGFGKLTSQVMKGLYSVANKIYHLDGKKKFWEKFLPGTKRAFIVFKSARLGYKELLALKRALNATFR